MTLPNRNFSRLSVDPMTSDNDRTMLSQAINLNYDIANMIYDRFVPFWKGVMSTRLLTNGLGQVCFSFGRLF
jgi:hypothetical protein